MIIYKDVISGDEIISDTNKIIELEDGLWEIDGKNIRKGADNFVLDGANPSAEGEDVDDGGDDGGSSEQVLDLADQFRWSKLEAKMSKKAYQGELKKYAKGVLEGLKAKGLDEKADNFKKTAPAAMKKILANWDNYDVYTGESMMEGSMYILVDYRDDGMTPYATVWAHALEEMKV